MSDEDTTAALFSKKKPHEYFSVEIEEAMERIAYIVKEYNPTGESFKEEIEYMLHDLVNETCEVVEKHHLEIEHKRSTESSNNMLRAAFAMGELHLKKEEE